ncbi:MAG TPA: NrfD/PsrC family molybdoenzyme membrane anchor subunit [Solirubrobacterales bacterium]|nr:NrfD/PsrC family molybdoenzyme membrane anchor subunit [Solirubrobacterales bacterium]
MSDARVTREGLEGVKPGRESKSWSGGGGGRGDGSQQDHPGDSYYGNSIINPPTWEEREIAGYLFAGGLAGASSILAAGADLTGRPRLARRAKLAAGAATGVSLAALIYDLGRPARFLNMLRVFKPTSPMSVGVWILTGYAPLVAAGAGSDVLGRAPRAGRAACLGAAGLGAGVASYTAALIANTAVPAWHGGRRELPFLFVGSAAGAGAGFGLIAAPLTENAPARRMAVLGAATELAAEQLLERRLGMVAETLHTGVAGRRLKLAKGLMALGALGAATVGRRNRPAAALSGAALLAGSALTRFGIFAAGMASAEDPKYTVEPQRQRLAAAAEDASPG